MTGILREERIGNQRLLLGDCMAILPGLGRVDAVVTDPPYGLGRRMQGGTWGAQDQDSGFLRWDLQARQEWADAILALGGGAVIWGGNYFTLPPTRCWLIWNKVNAVPTMADFEQAWTNLDRPSKRIDLPVGRVEYGHPTQKPLALMEWCLGFLPEARSILDPFMGSGTMLVACQRMGRHGTGIELDPGYFDIACRRVEDAARQPDLLIPATRAPAPEQQGFDL
jgi:site-specific DNA-methyltransferase (adenine-specific)/modification methylase